jgi:ligand-binding sensor domain-containing protein/signal transduction histidine kinase
MWFTTLGQGMYRYDRSGSRFTQFRHDHTGSNSIGSDSAFCALVDSAKTLWVGTAHGLNSLDKSRRLFKHYPSGPRDRVYTLFQDPHDSKGLLWIGSSDGLYVYDMTSDSFSRYPNDIARPLLPRDNNVRTIYADRKGRLWVGMKGGMARFDRSTRRFVSYLGGLYANTWGYVNKAWSICEDKAGTMWMVSHWGALRRFDEARNEWTPVSVASDHEILFHSVCEDRSGTLWFGTVADAVLKFDRARKPFINYTKVPGDASSLSSATVTGISEDASGAVWVGTTAGLNKLDPSTGTFLHYLHDSRNSFSLSNNEIWPVLEDRMGKLWIGTEGGGLDEFDRRMRRFVHHRFLPGNSLSLASDDVHSLCESRDGTLWIGTAPSVMEYLPAMNGFRRHPADHAKAPIWSEVRAMLEDHLGLIWIAVPGGGLLKYDRTSDIWTQYVRDPSAGTGTRSLGDMGVRSLCEDHLGTLWVGTDGGLFRFDRLTGTFTSFSVKDGLKDDYVDAILEDGKGCLWLGTANGLSKFNPQTGVFRNYDAGDGVTMGQCRLPTGYKNRKGEMFFGGSNGLLRFHPDSIRDNPFLPRIVLTGFTTADRPVLLDSAIAEKQLLTLSYRDNVISFEFAALNYTSPEKNQYAYKLEGFDGAWTYCGTRRYATYTNLDGGRYLFRVKGSNNDAMWNEEGVSIAVIITPPYWKTWWFTAMLWLTFAGSLAGIVRYFEMAKLKRQIVSLEHERAMESERIRISQDLHDEVGASLSKIAIISELAIKNSGTAGSVTQQLHTISHLSREVVDSVSAIVWAINPRNDKLDDLAGYVREYASDFFESTPIECRFDFPDELPGYPLSIEVRRTLFLVMKESLNNVVKHAHASKVQIGLNFTSAQIELRIQDNGRGFVIGDTPRHGNGLRNMRTRLEHINGLCTIQSRSDTGTLITFVVPAVRGIPR